MQKVAPDDFQYDLYLTNLDDSTTKAQRLPNPTTSLGKKPAGPGSKSAKAPTEKSMKGSKQTVRAPSSGPESDRSVNGYAKIAEMVSRVKLTSPE